MKSSFPNHSTPPPHEDHASDIDKLVIHRDWSMAPFTQLSSFLFTLTYPLFCKFYPGLPPHH